MTKKINYIESNKKLAINLREGQEKKQNLRRNRSVKW